MAPTVSFPRDAVSVQVSPGLSLLCCTPLLSNALKHSHQIDNPVSELNVSLNVSLPISICVNVCVTSINMLSHQLAMLKLPPQWVVASNTPLTLCTIGLQDKYRPCVIVSIVFNALLEWTATIASKKINPSTSCISFHLPCPVKTVHSKNRLMHVTRNQ